MATKKKSNGGSVRKGRPPMITKAGVKHGTRYGCGGGLKK